MIGRSGRRGKDTEGHIIYCNVNWKKLMKGKVGNIIGQNKILNNFNLLSKLTSYNSEICNNIYKNFLYKDIILKKIRDDFEGDNLELKIWWKLRYYEDKVLTWLKNHDILNMEYKISKFSKLDLSNFIAILIEIFIEGNINIDIKNIELSEDSNDVLLQYKQNVITTRKQNIK